MRALQLSKAELPPLSSDGVVLFRLTRMAHTREVETVLLESPMLTECRNRVLDAGCEIMPPWACALTL